MLSPEEREMTPNRAISHPVQSLELPVLSQLSKQREHFCPYQNIKSINNMLQSVFVATYIR